MNTSISLTIYDIVSYLFPGAALLLSLYYFSDIGGNLSDTQRALFLLVFGYLIGVLLHLLGHILYRSFYKDDFPKNSFKHKAISFIDAIIAKFPLLKVKRFDMDVKIELVKVIEKKFNINFAKRRLDLYNFADTYVASLVFQERDLLMAKESLLRSLTVLVIIEIVYLGVFIYPQHRFLILLFGLLIIEILRYGKEYHRIIKNQQIYTLTLIKLKQ